MFSNDLFLCFCVVIMNGMDRMDGMDTGGGVLPYIGYIGMCGPKGYGFSAVLVINRVSIIVILPPLWS